VARLYAGRDVAARGRALLEQGLAAGAPVDRALLRELGRGGSAR
jgi:hypothetical protein